ncbi:19694_t:CDS:2, partial [Funneliformis geosporum]
MSFTVNYLDKFEGWESALDPNSLSLLEMLEFRRTKKDFSFDKWTEHFTISKPVSVYITLKRKTKWRGDREGVGLRAKNNHLSNPATCRAWEWIPAQGEDVKSFWRNIETEKIESENNLLEAKIKQAEVQFSVDRTLTGNEAHRIFDQKKIDYANKNSIGEDKIRTVTLEEESSTKGKMDMSLGHKRSYDEELPSTSSKKISSFENEEELAEEDITQEDVLNSIAEVSDIFGKTKFPTYYNKLKSIWHNRDAETNYYVIDLGDEETLNQVHDHLSDNELNFLFERLRLTDEDECLSTEARRYMTLFDEMIEEESCNDGKIEDEENYTTGGRNSEEFERKVHQLDSLPKKFHYLSNTLPIPAESYDQSETPDVFVIKSVSCHIDTSTKMNGLMKSTPERTWTAHVLAYIFFVTFCFIDSLQYFSCERDISTKIDAQDDRYKADGVLELFERPRQIPLFLLEVSEGPNNPDPDKIKGDRTKLMNEGVFALNKFMISTELPEWKVCEALGVFLAQGFADKVEIGQIIFIGPGLYLFSPFTVPALTIPTSNTNLKHAPRLIRTLLCLRYNTIEKIEKFNELEKEGQQRIVKPITKYATGVTPGRSRVVTFSQFLPKISRESSK